MADLRATSSAVTLTAALRAKDIAAREMLRVAEFVEPVLGGYEVPPGFE